MQETIVISAFDQIHARSWLRQLAETRVGVGCVSPLSLEPPARSSEERQRRRSRSRQRETMELALQAAEQRLSASNSKVVCTATDAPYVLLETSMGKVYVELYWKHAPQTCQNFASLAARGYYDSTKFHRIIPGFMIQGGDPTATGKGGDSIYGSKFADEIHRELKHTGAGILSMANAGPNTNGSQFFISLAPTPWLDGKHTIFGRVASGMQVVKRLGQVATDSNDRPLDPVTIHKGGAAKDHP